MALLRRLAVTLTERAARQHCEEGQKKRERKKGETREKKRTAQNEEDAPGKKKETSEREKQIQFLSAPRQCCARNLLVALPWSLPHCAFFSSPTPAISAALYVPVRFYIGKDVSGHGEKGSD